MLDMIDLEVANVIYSVGCLVVGCDGECVRGPVGPARLGVEVAGFRENELAGARESFAGRELGGLS